jgi:hypothetical protein
MRVRNGQICKNAQYGPRRRQVFCILQIMLKKPLVGNVRNKIPVSLEFGKFESGSACKSYFL